VIAGSIYNNQDHILGHILRSVSRILEALGIGRSMKPENRTVPSCGQTAPTINEFTTKLAGNLRPDPIGPSMAEDGHPAEARFVRRTEMRKRRRGLAAFRPGLLTASETLFFNGALGCAVALGERTRHQLAPSLPIQHIVTVLLLVAVAMPFRTADLERGMSTFAGASKLWQIRQSMPFSCGRVIFPRWRPPWVLA